mgnify:FL=1
MFLPSMTVLVPRKVEYCFASWADFIYLDLVNHLSTFFKGFAMGAANVIPGVSGGTIAFVTGIYERLINSIKSFDGSALKLLLGRDFKGLWKHVDAGFLGALLLGVAVSVITLAKLLEIGFKEHPVLVSALFFGLIAASIYYVFKMVRQWSSAAVIGLLIGCALAVSLAFLPQAQESKNFIYLMICGVVAMCSMIIPGVSGSFVLLLMGNYQLIMIDSVNELRKGNLVDSLSVITPVAIGAVVGMAVLSRVLSWLFKKFHDVAVATITGFVAGSLVTIWPWKSAIYGTVIKDGEYKVIGYTRELPAINTELWAALGVMLIGAILMIGVEKMGEKTKAE